MEINLENNLEKNIKNDLEKKQNNFLETNIGRIINTAVDVGLRYFLPDLIEDELINVKDSMIKEGFKEGINTAINESINFGKSVLGIFTGKFENVNQMQKVVKNGGIIDNVSTVIEDVIKKTNNKGKISDNTAGLILKGKDILLENIDANIEGMMIGQERIEEKMKNAIKQWKNEYKNKDFDEMEIHYKTIKENLNKLLPLERIIKESRKIENLHNLIKNNGENFNLSEEELKLANIL